MTAAHPLSVSESHSNNREVMLVIEPGQYWICEADANIDIWELKNNHMISGFKVELKFEFSSFLVQGNINHNETATIF